MATAPNTTEGKDDDFERLKEWPWAIGLLYQAPRGDLIEGHAERHLSRALAIGRVTAFIGSGASAAYGRMGWLELIDAVSDYYLAEFESLQGQLQGNSLAWRIHALLRKHHKTAGDSKAVDQLARYQLAADLSREMAVAGREDDFAARVAWMVRDARGHVRWLFEQLRVVRAAMGTKSKDFDIATTLERSGEWLDEQTADVQNLVQALPETTLSPDLRPQRPTDYVAARLHRVVAALMLLSPQEQRKALVALFPSKQDNKPADSSISPKPRGDSARDPLKIVLSEFKINRFLTTNYDHEIENLFRDAGYRASAAASKSPGHLPSTPVRAVWRDVVFTYESSGELATLASRDRSAEAWVVHLHGRAERPGASEQSGGIIATEDDYRARYERLDKSRSVIDDTVRLTFGSSPLLFLGIGFDEIDLLRPLRQFMSAPGRMGDRLAIALLPRHSDETSSELRKIDLLQRFGVYTIHYGGDWLFRIHAVHRAVSAALEASRRWINLTLASTTNSEDLEKQSLLKKEADDAISRLSNEIDEAKGHVRRDHADAVVTFERNPEPHDDDESENEDPHLTHDLIDLGHAVASALAPLPVNPSAADADRLEAHAIRARGAVNSITTAALCKKLRDLQESRDEWIRDWYRLPVAKGLNESPGPVTLNRHLPVLPFVKDVRWPDNFYSGAASQTFNALTDAIKLANLDTPRGTRAFLFLAPRGLGKGHFFSALASRSRDKHEFQTLVRAGDGTLTAFVNLSFSIEIASVFDRLAEYLWHHATVDKLPEEGEPEAWKSLEHDRISRLRLALTVWSRAKKRALVAFNNVNLLFDREGRPKNRQIRELFNVIAPDSDDVKLHDSPPLDLVFVCSGAVAPGFFRNKVARLLQRSDISKRGELSTLRLLEECRILPQKDADTNRFVHVLHYARTTIVCTAFFPSVALQIAAKATGVAEFLPSKPGEQAQSVRDLFAQAPDSWVLQQPKKAIPRLLLAAVQRKDGLADLLSPEGGLRPEALTGDEAEFDGWLQRSTPSGVSKTQTDKIDKAFRDIYDACGESRFALTLLFSAMNEPLIALAALADERDRKAARNSVLLFKDTVCAEARRLPPVRRTDFIIRNVLEQMREHHERRSPLSTDAHAELERTLEGCARQSTPAPSPGLPMFDLQESILWHLSVSSIPLEAEVLSGCPLIRSSAVAALEDLTVQNARAIRDLTPIVKFAAQLLVSRCMAFKLEQTPPPPLEPKEDPVSHRFRYSVHRMVQRHFLRRTGAGFVEYPDIDEFSLTLYASQPNDTPYLTVEGHEQLRRTVSALSAHPEGVDAGRRRDEWPANQELQARRLRAAYSIVRSIYSVSAVSHFDIKHRRIDLPHPAGILMSPGFFEEHRRQILWLLHQARKFPEGEGGQASRSAPFYAEDIVWLYNEAGVLSLAEGHLPEALSLFDSADKAARRIDPHDMGPLRLLIQLNHAAAQIDRGRLQQADDILKHVETKLEKEPEAEKGELLWIARGYRAIVAHLKGYFEEAQGLYDEASKTLATARRSRAASLFARSHANMLLRNGEWEKARGRIQVALQLATDDSHEDMRHLALLTQARRSVAVLGDQNVKDGEQSRTIHANLNGIDQYARMMGMRKLASEVDEVRARLYLKNGDLQAAGTAAMNSLEVASLNELGIQKGVVLLLLADINLQRDHFPACRAYLEEAERVARETDYHIGTIDAQQIRDRLRAQDLTEEKAALSARAGGS